MRTLKVPPRPVGLDLPNGATLLGVVIGGVLVFATVSLVLLQVRCLRRVLWPICENADKFEKPDPKTDNATP